MPAPSTIDEFVDLVRKSAVLDEPRLSSYVQKLKRDASTPKELNGVAGLFVRDGLLTYFQAEQFLQGRWKRFTIGKYKVLEKLGSGGMGQVFLCEHKLMRRRVAVKVLPTAKAADPSSLDRFYREARAVAALDHINIVRAYDIDQDDNLHFLVMEYVDGASMQDMIRKSKRMDITRACHYMYWSAIGLQHAHANGLIHRDIKPGNILVDRTGVVKILDLGLARFFHDEDDMLTKKYDESVLGTADYLAPEQAIDSHTVDGRADIYSLGATFYFLLTGGPPFAEGSVAQKLLWHQTRIPKPIREVRPEVPENVAAILEKMMAKKPEDRYATPAELAEALLPLTQTPIGPPPDDEMPQLSAAAMGNASGQVSVSSAPRTMVTAPRTPMPNHLGKDPVTPSPRGSESSKPATAVAEADTQRKLTAPVVEPIPDSNPGTGPIWEAIGAETSNAARADTDRKKRGASSRTLKKKSVELEPQPERSSSKSDLRRLKQRRTSMGMIFAIVGGLIVIVGGLAALYFLGVFGQEKLKTTPNLSIEPKTLYLTKSPGGALHHYASLGKAIEEFRTGDTIVIKDDEWEEFGAVSSTKGFSIRPEGNKTVTWRAPANVKNVQERPLLTIANAEGARVTGINFDAGGVAPSAVRITGMCPDLLLENLTLANATVADLSVHDCTSVESHPVIVRKCRFTSVAGKEAKSGVVFTSSSPARTSRGVKIENCLFEGPFTSGAIQFEGSAMNIDIRNCRIWKADNGVWFRKMPAPSIWQVNIVSNTFHTFSGATIRFEDLNQMKLRNETRITINQNFFGDGPAAISLEGGDLLNTKLFVMEPNSNAIKNGVQPGNAPITMVVASPGVDVNLNPADRANFLMYDKNSFLFTAIGNKLPAGVPPQ